MPEPLALPVCSDYFSEQTEVACKLRSCGFVEGSRSQGAGFEVSKPLVTFSPIAMLSLGTHKM